MTDSISPRIDALEPSDGRGSRAVPEPARDGSSVAVSANQDGRLRLDPELSRREGIGAACDGILSFIAQQVAQAPSDPSRAVHACRKSVRRLRALLRLVRPAVATRRWSEMNKALRKSVRATSSLRDARVLVETLGLVPDADKGAKSRARIAELIGEDLARLELESHERSALEGLTARLDGLAERFRASLPDDLHDTELNESLVATYASTRRAFRQAARERVIELTHEWRKRVKELRYQCELLEPVNPGLEPLRTDLATLAQDLGAITDLDVLERHVRGLEKREKGLQARKLRKQIKREARRRLDEVVGGLGEVLKGGRRAFVNEYLPGA